MTNEHERSDLKVAYEVEDYEDDDEKFDSEDIALSASKSKPIAELIETRLSRRTALGGMAAFAAAGAFGAPFIAGMKPAAAETSSLKFQELPHAFPQIEGVDVAPGYGTQVLIRWGDKVTGDAPDFDINNQTAAAQEKQFGQNNDFMAYKPLPYGSDNSEHGLLCVSHEYTTPNLMWSVGVKKGSYDKLSKDQMEVEMAAHGHSIIEIKKTGRKWQVVEGSRYNRRITPLGTAMHISGPAAAHDRLKTKADPTGTRVIGTVNNCAGGTTPWGTVLIAEENFNSYFRGGKVTGPEARNYKRLGLPRKGRWAWSKIHDRFNVDKEPNEANRFGWVVEIDPYDPNSTPIKRTAIGRFKHECATTVVNPDGTITVYSGDDQRYDYLYKFVTQGRYNPNERAANRNLLDSGTLYVAKFNADGTMRWLPLVFATGPLTPENGFNSQADVLIETRRAADLLGATPMDRPEDVDTNPVNGHTYVMLTDNSKRKPEEVNAANPRAKSKHGHIIELIPPKVTGEPKMGFTSTWPAPIVADHAALEYRWEFFLLGGDPARPEDGAKYHSGVTKDGWLSTPDNCAFDNKGRIWISTDGQPKKGFSDSVYGADTDGPARGLTRCFFNSPIGAEICGPTFTPDGRTLFVAIQHPGDYKDATFDNPPTRWPDFTDGMPPRASVVAITKDDGGEIGS